MQLTINHARQRYINWPLVSKVYALTAVLLLVLLVFGVRQAITGYQWMQRTEARIAQYQQEAGQAGGTLQIDLSQVDPAQLRQELARAQQLLDRDAFRWTGLFDRMEQLLPPHVTIVGFAPDYGKGTVAVEGLAREVADLRQLLDNLFRAGAFRQVYLKSQSTADVTGADGRKAAAVSFSIQLEGAL